MGSSVALEEGLRLCALSSALFLGLSVATLVWALLRRGDGFGGRRVSGAAITLSLAIGLGAWAGILYARSGAAPGPLALYSAIGFALGALAGLFPKAVGVPAFIACAAAAVFAASGLSGWQRWEQGAPVARLFVFDAAETGSLCGFSADGEPELNLKVGPGALALEVDVVDVSGPLVAFYGPRLYRLSAVTAGGVPSALPGDRGPLLRTAEGARLAVALGLRLSTARSGPVEAQDLASAGFTLGPGAALSVAPGGRY